MKAGRGEEGSSEEGRGDDKALKTYAQTGLCCWDVRGSCLPNLALWLTCWFKSRTILLMGIKCPLPSGLFCSSQHRCLVSAGSGCRRGHEFTLCPPSEPFARISQMKTEEGTCDDSSSSLTGLDSVSPWKPTSRCIYGDFPEDLTNQGRFEHGQHHPIGWSPRLNKMKEAEGSQSHFLPECRYKVTTTSSSHGYAFPPIMDFIPLKLRIKANPFSFN